MFGNGRARQDKVKKSNGIAKFNMTPRWFCSAWYCWGKAIKRAVMAKNAELINGMA